MCYSWVPRAGVKIGSIAEEERETGHGNRRQSPRGLPTLGRHLPDSRAGRGRGVS